MFMALVTTYSQLLQESEERLQQAGISNAQFEAMWILEHALGVSLLQLKIDPQGKPDPECVEQAIRLIGRRAAHEPLQYILGSQEFYGRDMMVGPGVLIPRPESELLVDLAREHVERHESPLLVDVGTGSGCLAISLAAEIPGSMVIGIDRSVGALARARENANRHRMQEQIYWMIGDLLAPLLSIQVEGKVGAIIANLPYIAHTEWDRLSPAVKEYEPRLALDGGPDGLDVYRRLLQEAPLVLRPGGWVFMEVGVDQAGVLCRLVKDQGVFEDPMTRADSQGIPRVVFARLKNPHSV